jgi:putative ABC transport system substrate-binding protein
MGWLNAVRKKILIQLPNWATESGEDQVVSTGYMEQTMLRRTFALVLGSLFLQICHLAHAQQQAKIARIGYLNPGDPVTRAYRTEAFRQGLKELGYIEGKNIHIEYRFAEAKPERLPELARELVSLNVDIIFAGGGPATEAVKNATQMIPIVTSSQDPVRQRFVAGLPRPGEETLPG